VPLIRYLTATNDTPHFGVLDGEVVYDLPAPKTLQAALQLTRDDLLRIVQTTIEQADTARAIADITLLPPIDAQEVWAAGVTYERSRDARMEESTEEDVYDRVYDADRPELFFKATPGRVSGPDGDVAIRGDSTWDVPEPELALIINRHEEVIGYTIGNDVSSRSIEGENPLYLPQAKVYAGSTGLGPAIVLVNELADPLALNITLTIERGDGILFEGTTSTRSIHRTLDDLVDYLHRYNRFLDGVILLTGTGIVPPAEVTLEHGDVVTITIDELGTLRNPVVRLKA